MPSSILFKNFKPCLNKSKQILSPKNKIAKYLALLLVIPVIAIPNYRLYKKRQNPLYAQGIKYLPHKIRTVIRTKQWPRHMALLIIKNKKLSSYGNFVEEYWINHLKIIENTIVRLLQNNTPIPDGYYFLSLEDGIDEEYDLPILAYAADYNLVAKNKVILLPDYDIQMIDCQAHIAYTSLLKSIMASNSKYRWDQKISKILWRGGANGLPRVQFMRDVAYKYNFLDAGLTHYNKEKDKKLLASFRKEFITPEDSLKYKYLLDIDGYSCSYSRMAWILTSNSLLLKHSSPNIQWYYHKLKPYVHYLPIKSDFSDLQDQYEWAEENQHHAQQMIANAQGLAREVFTPVAIELAVQEAFIQYSKVLPNHIAAFDYYK